MSLLSPYFVNVHFTNEEGQTLVLKYQLFENCMLSRWIELMKEAVALPDIKVENNGHFYGKNFYEEHVLEAKLNDCIEKVNSHLDQLNRPDKKIHMKAKIPMGLQFLNELHEIFEHLEPDGHINTNGDISKTLQEMNITIHQAELFIYDNSDNDHVQVLLVPPTKKPLHIEDYSLFSPDYVYGNMYLTYGMTGVPTKDAFIHNAAPTPQNVYSSGMYLCFGTDKTFGQHAELHEWLIDKGVDPKDPKSAIGYIPLAQIVSPDISDRDNFLKKLAHYRNITKVEIEKENDVGLKDKLKSILSSSNPIKQFTPVLKMESPQKFIPKKAEAVKPVIKKPAPVSEGSAKARWPFDAEAFYHLDYCPYIDLNIEFNAKELLEEAQRALNYFVVHRDYDQSSTDETSKWRSLGLRSLFGDYTKTQYHTSYTFEGDPVYKQTVFSELCPKTMAFLNKITNVDECERVRFMLLEPGARIKVHRDSETRDVCLAVNISLNMPKECVFYADLNADGTQNAFTKILPFKDSGSVLLFNNAKYHTVVNNSDEPRIHIIFHGPIKFSDSELLQLARNQNNIFSRKELVKNLIKKKSIVGESLEKTPRLFNDWIDSGLDTDSIPESIQLCAWDHSTFQSEEKRKALNLITLASMFPFDVKVITEEMIEGAIEKAISEDKSHIVLMAAGTFMETLNEHIFSMVQFCHQMSRDRHVIAGHILDDQHSANLPYFHEQYLIINLQEWKKIKGLSLGSLHSSERMLFPSYNRSKDNFHDHYTPFWISPGQENPKREGLVNWGTKVIAELISINKVIINIPRELRHRRLYAYPRDNNESAWKQVTEKISGRLNFSKNEVYTFNNEILNIGVYESIKPNTFISVAAGFKPFKIIQQYGLSSGDKFHFLDFSETSLQYYKELLTSKSYEDLHFITTKYSRAKHGEKADELCMHQLNSLIRDHFNNSVEELLKVIKTASGGKVEFEDMIKNSNSLADRLDSNSRFVIWVSNVFYNNSLYFILTSHEAKSRFTDTIMAIAKKMNTRAFIQINTNTILFGKDIRNPIGLITDGGMRSVSNDYSDWIELTN